MADTYNTISHLDLSGGIDTRNSEDKIPDGYSEQIVNLDTTTTGQIKLRSGYTPSFGYTPIRVISAKLMLATYETVIQLTLEDRVSTSIAGPIRIGITGALSFQDETGFVYTEGTDWTFGFPTADTMKIVEGWLTRPTTIVISPKEQNWTISEDRIAKVPEMFVHGLVVNSDNPAMGLISAGTAAYNNSISTAKSGGKELECVSSAVIGTTQSIAAVVSKSLMTVETQTTQNASKAGIDVLISNDASANTYIGKIYRPSPCGVLSSDRGGRVAYPFGAYADDVGRSRSAYFDGSSSTSIAATKQVRIESGNILDDGMGRLVGDPRIYLESASFTGTTGQLTLKFPGIPQTVASDGSKSNATLSDITSAILAITPAVGVTSTLPLIVYVLGDSTISQGSYFVRSIVSYTPSAGGSTLVINVDLGFNLIKSYTASSTDLYASHCVFNYDFISIINDGFSYIPRSYLNTSLVSIPDYGWSYGGVLPVIAQDLTVDSDGGNFGYVYTHRNGLTNEYTLSTSYSKMKHNDAFIDQPGGNATVYTAIGYKSLYYYNNSSSTATKAVARTLDRAIEYGNRLLDGSVTRCAHVRLAVQMVDNSGSSLSYASDHAFGPEISVVDSSASALDQESGRDAYRYSWKNGSRHTSVSLDQNIKCPDTLAGDTIYIQEQGVGSIKKITLVTQNSSSETTATKQSICWGVLARINARLYPILSSVYKNTIPTNSSTLSSTIAIGDLEPASAASPEFLKSCSYLGSWRTLTAGGEGTVTYGFNFSQNLSDNIRPLDTVLIYGLFGGRDSIASASAVYPDGTLAGTLVPNPVKSDMIQLSNVNLSAGTTYIKALPITRSTEKLSSITATKQCLYACSGTGDSVYRYDTKTISPAGPMDWYPGLVACAAPDVGGLTSPVVDIVASSTSGTNIIKFPTAVAGTLVAGSMLQLNDANKTIVTVVSIDRPDPTTDSVEVAPALPSPLPATLTCTKLATYRYYFRIATTDANGTRTVGPAVQSKDMIVSVPNNSGVRLLLLAPPRLTAYDLANVDIEIYRTKANVINDFYFITAIPVDFSDPSKYITYTDQLPDSLLTTYDPLSGVVGANLGTGLTTPPAGNFMTSTSSRLFIADYKQPDELSLVLKQDPTKPGVQVGPQYVDSVQTNVTALSKGDSAAYVAGLTVGSLVVNVSPASDAVGTAAGLTHPDIEICGSHFVAKTSQRTYAFIDPQVITTPVIHPTAPSTAVVRPELYGLHACRNASSAGLSYYEFAGGMPIRKYRFATGADDYITIKNGNTISCDYNDGDTIMFNSCVAPLSTSKVYRVRDRAVSGNDVKFKVSEVWPTFDASLTAADLAAQTVYPANYVVSRTYGVIGALETNVAIGGATLTFLVPSPTMYKRGEVVDLYKLKGDAGSPAEIRGVVDSVGTTLATGSNPVYRVVVKRDITTAGLVGNVDPLLGDWYRIRPTLGVTSLLSCGTDLPVMTGTQAVTRNMITTETVTDGRQTDIYTKRVAQVFNMANSAIPTPLMPGAIKTPFVSKSGNDYSAGQIVLRSLDGSTITAVVPPRYTLEGSLKKVGARNQVRAMWYVNGKRASKEGEVNSITSSPKAWSNRVGISLKEYPEIFDSLYIDSDKDSYGFVDVSSNDGSVITGILPFFGKSSFTAAQQEPSLLVFKSNSIYLIDVEERTRVLGLSGDSRKSFLNRIQTNGVGCSYPNAFTEVPDGVIFVHTSGVYKLTRDMQIKWVGEKLDGLVKSVLTDKSVVSCVTWPYKQKAIVGYSVPSSTATYNATTQMVYDYSRERAKTMQATAGATALSAGGITAEGAWTTYSGVPMVAATSYKDSIVTVGWDGQLYELLPGNASTDYMDLGQPISFTWTYKAVDFGDSGRRKSVAAVVTSMKATSSLNGIVVAQASDLSRTFTTLGDVINLDMTNYKVVAVRSSLKDRKFNYLQLKYTGTVSANALEFTGLDFSVAPLTYHGVKSAADT